MLQSTSLFNSRGVVKLYVDSTYLFTFQNARTAKNQNNTTWLLTITFNFSLL